MARAIRKALPFGTPFWEGLAFSRRMGCHPHGGDQVRHSLCLAKERGKLPFSLISNSLFRKSQNPYGRFAKHALPRALPCVSSCRVCDLRQGDGLATTRIGWNRTINTLLRGREGMEQRVLEDSNARKHTHKLSGWHLS